MPKRRKKKSSRKASRAGVRNTTISGHRRVGKQLVPPAAGIPNLQKVSWMDDRLPEMLWAALLAYSFERYETLGYFRRVITFIGQHEQREELHDVTLSGIARLDEELRNEIIEFICDPLEAAEALSPLCLFESLPARETWLRNLPPTEFDSSLLMGAVGATLWHQSQNATDCRWMRVTSMAMAGKIKMHTHMSEMLFNYPAEVDHGEVEGFVRTMEMNRNPNELVDLEWPIDFWRECWEKTECIEAQQTYQVPSFEDTLTHRSLADLRKHLLQHWRDTHVTTAVDAKHDAVFGMGFYCLRILEEMMGLANGTSVLGRLGLRTILEVRVNMQFLLRRDDSELWKKWREFGSGQAKLNAMKFRDSIEPPEYIDLDSIEMIASEDMWEELLTVDLSSWSGLDLRKMSERSGLKDTYDRFYPWTSGYSHAMWGAIRESCFQVCANPLHRMHRYPDRLSLQDTVGDATGLVEEILELIDASYPSFSYRLMSG